MSTSSSSRKPSGTSSLSTPAQANRTSVTPGEIEAICLPVTTETLCSLIHDSDIAFYLTETGSPDHPAFLGLRAALMAELRGGVANHRGSNRHHQEMAALITLQRRLVRLQMGLEAFAGMTSGRLHGFVRRVLVVYGADPDALSVSLTLPAHLLLPPTPGRTQ